MDKGKNLSDFPVRQILMSRYWNENNLVLTLLFTFSLYGWLSCETKANLKINSSDKVTYTRIVILYMTSYKKYLLLEKQMRVGRHGRDLRL